jgi:hypothetical protein
MATSASAPAPAALAAPPGRLMSLDVFRGATIASMMLVNNPGSWSHLYRPLAHAEWHGWTFTDTVFPFFLWIVGVAIPLSVAKRLEQGQSRRQLFLHALRRAAILFSLGLFLSRARFPSGHPLPRAEEDRVRGLREEAEQLFNETDFALVADFCCLGPFEGACFLRGYEQFCIDLVVNPMFAQTLLAKITEMNTDINHSQFPQARVEVLQESLKSRRS